MDQSATIELMVTEAERFAARLNEALDDLDYPGHGRIVRVARDWKPLSTTAVRKWLKGEGMPDTKRIADLARRYNVNAEWLLTGQGPKRGVPNAAAQTPYLAISEAAGARVIRVPMMDARGSMGQGLARLEEDTVLGTLPLSEEWVRRNLTVSNPSNLATITAYGDSMAPTFSDGDILMVDRGVADLRLDAVYVIDRNGELFIKRVQRRMDGSLVIKSDNQLYDPYVVTDGERESLRVLGRVLWAWNGKRL